MGEWCALMTLNLMLTSRNAVYLSGDFRLISVVDQIPLPDSYDTQKLIPVIRHDWAALIAYMGIASAPPVIADMGQWIGEQVDAIRSDGQFDALLARLLDVNRFLDRIRGDRRVASRRVEPGRERCTQRRRPAGCRDIRCRLPRRASCPARRACRSGRWRGES